MEQKRIISGLDVLKFIMSIMIVDIHVKGYLILPPHIQNNLIQPIENLAVPTFFVISSFLFFKKVRDAENQRMLVWHYIKRLSLLYLFWCIVWSPIIYIQKDYFHPLQATIPLLLMRDFFLGSMFDASWFFGALLVGVPLVWCLSRIFKKDILVIIIPLVIHLSLKYMSCLPEAWKAFYDWYASFEMPQLSFLSGLLWITIGYILADKIILDRIKNIRNVWVWLVFVVCFVWQQCFPIVPMLPGVLCVSSLFVAAYTWQLPEHPQLYRRFRTYSILFYVIHDCFKKIPKQLFGWENGPVLFVVTLAFCFLASEVILRMKEVKGFGWLRYAY